MARLFLIRHGEPEAQWGGGPDDPGLSEAGRAQARAAASALAGTGRSRILTSPMRRCRETAAPYAEIVGGEAFVDARFSEVTSPADERDRRDWLRQRFGWRPGDAARDWDGLEPPLQSWRREMLACAGAIRSDTAVFTHFVAINALVGAAQDSARTIVCRPAYASICELACADGALRLVSLGEQSGIGEVR